MPTHYQLNNVGPIEHGYPEKRVWLNGADSTRVGPQSNALIRNEKDAKSANSRPRFLYVPIQPGLPGSRPVMGRLVLKKFGLIETIRGLSQTSYDFLRLSTTSVGTFVKFCDFLRSVDDFLRLATFADRESTPPATRGSDDQEPSLSLPA
jgi:hypothetical protein